MDTEPSRAVRAIPFVMFLIFAVFWSALDLVYGVELAVLPSVIVGAALGVRAVTGRRGTKP